MKKNTLTSIYKELSALCEESFASDTDRFSFTLAGGVLLGDRNPDYTTYSLYRRHFFLVSEGNQFYVLIYLDNYENGISQSLQNLPLEVSLTSQENREWSTCIEGYELMPTAEEYMIILRISLCSDQLPLLVNQQLWLNVRIAGKEPDNNYFFFLKDFGKERPCLKLQSLDFLLDSADYGLDGSPHTGIPVGWEPLVHLLGKVDTEMLYKGLIRNPGKSIDHTDALEYECVIFSSEGREVLFKQDQFTLSYGNSEGEIEVSLSSFLSFSELEAGDYICAIYFAGKPWIHAPFSISEQKKEGSPCLSFLQSYTQKVLTETHALEKLQAMIGLSDVKSLIMKNLQYMKLMEARKLIGLSAPKRLLHMVMSGNPGTGKTTVARLLGNIYHEMGILSKGHLVEVNRDTLVDNMIGGSEKRTREAIERAKGGVLFVDEAYSLTPIGVDDKDYGRQVLDTLLPELSDPQDLVVVFAGYEKEMDALLQSNPGLASRFPIRLKFADYSLDELVEITRLYFDTHMFCPTTEAYDRLRLVFDQAMKVHNFGNGRFVKTFIENEVLPAMASRLYGKLKSEGGLNDVRMLSEIIASDIPAQHNTGSAGYKLRETPVIRGFRTGR